MLYSNNGQGGAPSLNSSVQDVQRDTRHQISVQVRTSVGILNFTATVHGDTHGYWWISRSSSSQKSVGPTIWAVTFSEAQQTGFSGSDCDTHQGPNKKRLCANTWWVNRHPLQTVWWPKPEHPAHVFVVVLHEHASGKDCEKNILGSPRRITFLRSIKTLQMSQDDFLCCAKSRWLFCTYDTLLL